MCCLLVPRSPVGGMGRHNEDQQQSPVDVLATGVTLHCACPVRQQVSAVEAPQRSVCLLPQSAPEAIERARERQQVMSLWSVARERERERQQVTSPPTVCTRSWIMGEREREREREREIEREIERERARER